MEFLLENVLTLYYLCNMRNINATLTIRMRGALREKLRKSAKRLEKRDSELARELIEHGLEERSMYSREYCEQNYPVGAFAHRGGL